MRGGGLHSQPVRWEGKLLTGLVSLANVMPDQHYSLRAHVSTESPDAIKPILDRLFTRGSVSQTGDGREFLIEAEMDGPSARDLNRALLTELRRVEKRTRLRSEWTWRTTTERFFDYVPKGRRSPSRAPPPHA